ncbi:DUF3306 domain-containing protein [Nitratireductor luteus]|uniref:DUF3306 domain-containing protein n=1 Tax=Nitratireductor luteus TaxID=2976980 RepID=UPI00223E90C2|nr:DUF3306 domain-containing protein [Nitratireductor luteus]
MAEPGDEGFLSRWSRRKREVSRQDADEVSSPDEAGEEPSAEAINEEMEANRLAAEAIDIDSLEKGDDFSLFLKRGVPTALRTKALRRLWQSNPLLANLDGLNDYDTDFNDPAHNTYSSLWQVGRGFLSKSEQQRQRDTGGIREASEDKPDEADGNEESRPAVSVVEQQEVTSSVAQPEADPAESVGSQTAPPDGEDAGDGEEDERPRQRVSIRRRLEG